jgi:tetratricopeptide (TPR) repeat protein
MAPHTRFLTVPKPVADLFDMQDEIVARLANSLNAQLVAAEVRRPSRAPNPDSLDLYFQGMARLNKGVATGNVAEAHNFFERALDLDPDNVDAMVGAAIANVFVAATFVDDAGGALVARTEATLIKALTLAPDHAAEHCWLGRLLIGSKRPSQGIAECERALALDRNLASAHAFIGLGKNAVGRAEETEAHVQEALRLSPRDTLAYRWMFIAGSAKLALGADEEAAPWLRRAVESNRTSAIAHYMFAAALVRLGRADEARSAAREGRAIDPTFTIHRFRLGAASENPIFLARRERVIEGLRAGGVPDG